MNLRPLILFALLAIGAAALLTPDAQAPTRPSCPGPNCPTPAPAPVPEPAPPKPRPWGPRTLPVGSTAANLVGKISLGGHVSPSGQEVMIDYPDAEWIKNIGSQVDGAGMCVASSVEMALRWQNREEYRGFRDWCARKPGGAYPEKVDGYFRDWTKEKGLPPARYLNYQGNDLEVLRAALRTGLMPGVTYSGRDGVRYRGPIAHMVCLAHLSASEAAILDNNVSTELIWMSPEEFQARWTGGRNGWAVIPLYAGPPLPPANQWAYAAAAAGSPYGNPGYASADYAWTAPDVCGFQQLLFRGRLVGRLDGPASSYQRYDEATQSYPDGVIAPPVSPPALGVPTGVIWSSVGRGEVFVLNGCRVDKSFALGCLTPQQAPPGPNAPNVPIPDADGKLRLTVIGPRAQTDRVLQDLEQAPELAPWKGQLLVQAYAPTHWAVAGLGFKTDGNPTIYLQSGARVLHRQDGYAGPAELAGALRRADPKYTPAADPNLNSPLAGLGLGLPPLSRDTWLGLAAGGLVAWFLAGRKKP